MIRRKATGSAAERPRSVSDRIFSAAVILFLAAGLFSVVLRLGTRALVKKGILGLRATRIVFFDNELMREEQERLAEASAAAENRQVCWPELYPPDSAADEYYRAGAAERNAERNAAGGGPRFAAGGGQGRAAGKSRPAGKDIALQIPRVKAALAGLEKWINENFILRNFWIGLFYRVKKLSGVSRPDGEFGSNGVYRLPNGHLTSFKKKTDVTLYADALRRLSDFLKSEGTPFLYVQAPFKIDPADGAVSGRKDFSNQNMDELLALLDGSGVASLDMRAEIKKAGMSHYDCFYRTDHHWKAETGLWAAGIIAEKLNELWDLKIDAGILDSGNFDFRILPESFLGSAGRAVTLADADMEDLTLITPKAGFSVTAEFYSRTSLLRRQSGGFDALLFPEQIQTRETAYTKSAYAVYMDGDTNARVKNGSAENGLRILMLGDSFTDTVEPFFALAVRELDTLDLRHFDGSLSSWILQEGKYDAAVMILNGSALSGADIFAPGAERSLWDFR